MKHFENFTDQQLIQLYLAGNAEALGTIVMRYKKNIYTTIYLLVRDQHIADDLFQDVFIRIIDNLKSGGYKEGGKFLYWAIRIAQNICMDHFRKIKRTPTIKTSDSSDIFEVFNCNEPGADYTVVKEEKHERVRVMIDRLPEEQREVIILRHYADLSFKEIACVTKCSTNTALGRMRYALINLRRMAAEKQMAY